MSECSNKGSALHKVCRRANELTHPDRVSGEAHRLGELHFDPMAEGGGSNRCAWHLVMHERREVGWRFMPSRVASGALLWLSNLLFQTAKLQISELEVAAEHGRLCFGRSDDSLHLSQCGVEVGWGGCDGDFVWFCLAGRAGG